MKKHPKVLWCYREKGEPGMFASETIGGCVPAMGLKRRQRVTVGEYVWAGDYDVQMFGGLPFLLPTRRRRATRG